MLRFLNRNLSNKTPIETIFELNNGLQGANRARDLGAIVYTACHVAFVGHHNSSRSLDLGVHAASTDYPVIKRAPRASHSRVQKGEEVF